MSVTAPLLAWPPVRPLSVSTRHRPDFEDGKGIEQLIHSLKHRLARNLDEVAHLARQEGAATALLFLAGRPAAIVGRLLRRHDAPLETEAPISTTPLFQAPRDNGCEPLPLKPGILFVGYVEAGLGIGESLRGLVNSAADAGLPFAIQPHNVNAETRFIGRFREDHYDAQNAYEITVIECTVDELSGAIAALGPRLTSGTRTIFRTYWELPEAPRHWAPLLQSVDEIWAPTRFVADAFRQIFDGPITIVPPCVDAVERQSRPRSHFGLQEDRFYYLFSFDYFSFLARKNPLGVVEAFEKAFPRGDEPVGLVIKSTGPENGFRKLRKRLAKAAKRDPRIVILDRNLPRNDMVGLLETADAYVSLHRSEGFGLGMAEAMSFAKPVIGTDFSGSTDFLSSATGYPVPYTLRPVRRWEYPNADGQMWAEPDINAAADAMMSVFSDRLEAHRRSMAARIFISDRFGRKRIGSILRKLTVK